MYEKVNAVTMIANAVIARARFVKLDADGRVIQAAAAGDDAIGVSLEAAAAAGDPIPVAVMDGSKVEVEAGAAIVVSGGALSVTSDATGRAVTGGAAADRMLGYALTAAAAAGEFITVLLAKGASHNSATGV